MIYEVSDWLSRAQKRRVSLTKAVSAIFQLLLEDGWFDKNRERILEQVLATDKEGQDAKDRNAGAGVDAGAGS